MLFTFSRSKKKVLASLSFQEVKRSNPDVFVELLEFLSADHSINVCDRVAPRNLRYGPAARFVLNLLLRSFLAATFTTIFKSLL